MKRPTLHRIRSVWRNISLAPLLLCLAACHHAPVSAPAPAGAPANRVPPFQGADSIAFGGVTLAQGDALERGHANDLLVHIEYTLVTRDSASLVLALEQFRNPESCALAAKNSAQPALVVPSQAQIAIVRGTHELQVPITWPGDTGKATDGIVFGAGAISFQASMRSDQPDYEFLVRRFGTEFCERF
jgi:hypothetical protein